jgi:hypothetical protein
VGLPWNPFASERLAMTTALSPDECLARIRDNLYVPWTIRGTRPGVPFRGSMRGNRFSLFKHVGMIGVGQYGNAFRVMAVGSVTADPMGKTLISVRLAHLFVSRLWLALPAIGCAAFLLVWLLRVLGILHLDPRFPNPIVIIGVAIVCFCFQYAAYLLMYGINYLVTRDEGRFLVNTLSQIFDAHTIPLRL